MRRDEHQEALLIDHNIVVLSHDDVQRQMARGARLLDIRSPREFVQIHLEGALPVAGARFGLPVLSGHDISSADRVIVVANSPVSGQVAAREVLLLGADVIGIFASLSRSWAPKGLPVRHGLLIQPKDLLPFINDHAAADIVDIRELVEQERFPFTESTLSLPYSTWPEAGDGLNANAPVVFVSGNDERSIAAAQALMVRGVTHDVGYLVGGYARYLHGDHYDVKEIARTTARHGAFI